MNCSYSILIVVMLWLSQAFGTCPDNIDEIDQRIHHVRAQADCLYETDQRVVQEYEQRGTEIHRLDKKVCISKTWTGLTLII